MFLVEELEDLKGFWGNNSEFWRLLSSSFYKYLEILIFYGFSMKCLCIKFIIPILFNNLMIIDQPRHTISRREIIEFNIVFTTYFSTLKIPTMYSLSNDPNFVYSLKIVSFIII